MYEWEIFVPGIGSKKKKKTMAFKRSQLFEALPKVEALTIRYKNKSMPFKIIAI